MEIVRHRFSPMRASGWFSDEQEPLQEWIYTSNIYGDMLASPNGLFGFLPTFYPQKASILTEVMGEDKKTLTIFSTLAKNSVKFFSQNRFTRAFLLLWATSSTFAATAATCPLKLKKLSFRSCKRLREMVYYL